LCSTSATRNCVSSSMRSRRANGESRDRADRVEKDRGSRLPRSIARIPRRRVRDRSSTDSTPRGHFLCENGEGGGA
jgi:hypothetical protein